MNSETPTTHFKKNSLPNLPDLSTSEQEKQNTILRLLDLRQRAYNKLTHVHDLSEADREFFTLELADLESKLEKLGWKYVGKESLHG